MQPNVGYENRNAKTLASFVSYCKAHPSERFWQALRNWSGFKFVWVGWDTKRTTITFDTFNFEGRNG
jgi:hypothetical protein